MKVFTVMGKAFLYLFLICCLLNSSQAEDEKPKEVQVPHDEETNFDHMEQVNMEAVGISEKVVDESQSPEVSIDNDASIDASNSSSINATEASNSTSTPRPKRVACIRRLTEVEHESTEEQLQVLVGDDEEEDEGVQRAAADVDGENESFQKPLLDQGIHIVNGTYLLQLLSEQYNSSVINRTTPAQCSMVFFFAKWCPFSAEAAPHFNAMARAYPDLTLFAVDSSKYSGLNTQFGILALPTVLLFHNSKPVSKFNHTVFTLENYATFLSALTGLEADTPLEVSEEDYVGPLPSVAEPEPDYYLYLSWSFTILCLLGYLSKSSFTKRIIESIRNNWREVEIQHEHLD